MGRPRKHFGDLPPRLRCKRGAFYYVTDGTWRPLGRSREAALREYRVLEDLPPGAFLDGARILWSSRRNAKLRGIPHELGMAELRTLIARAGRCCEVTGIPFSYDRVGPSSRSRSPWGMSLDRIDSSKGYTVENCRLVCTAVNLAMNEWGEDVLERIALY